MCAQWYGKTSFMPSYCLPNNHSSSSAETPKDETEGENRLGNIDIISVTRDQNQDDSSTNPYPNILQHLDAFDPKIQQEFSSLLRELSRSSKENKRLYNENVSLFDENIRLFDENITLRNEIKKHSIENNFSMRNEYNTETPNKKRILSPENKDGRIRIVNSQSNAASSSKERRQPEHERLPFFGSPVPINQDFNNNDSVGVSGLIVGVHHPSLMQTPKEHLSSSNALCPDNGICHKETPTTVMVNFGDDPSKNIRDNANLCPSVAAIEDHSKKEESDLKSIQKLNWKVPEDNKSLIVLGIEKDSKILKKKHRDHVKRSFRTPGLCETYLTNWHRCKTLQMCRQKIWTMETSHTVMHENVAQLEQKPAALE